MCTSIVVNKRKTIVGWNLDLLDMEHRVRVAADGVYIEILDKTEGWMPLFGANSGGGFVGMPTCWPHDPRSDPSPSGEGRNVILLDMDYLMQRTTMGDVLSIVGNEQIFSVPGLTFMSSLSDADGNVLHIVPGQGYRYYEKPDHAVLTNFSPFKGNSETHPWMGWDRYLTAESMLKDTADGFDAVDCFEVLRAVSQEVCPTVVSMVFDVTERTVYWCENREWNSVKIHKFER